MRSTWIKTGVVSLGVFVGACVISQWQATYPGPNNYSNGEDILVAPDGSVFMSGSFDNGEAFVVKYSAPGKQLWSATLKSDGLDLGRAQPEHLQLDKDGNLYVARFDYESLSGVYFKLNASGETLASWASLEQPGVMTIADDQIYVAQSGYSLLQVFDLNGELQWEYAHTDALSALVVPHPILVQGDQVVATRADALYEFDRSGNLVHMVLVSDLQLDGIIKAGYIDGQLIVVGSDAGMLVGLTVNAEFEVDSRHTLYSGPEAIDQASVTFGVDSVCVSTDAMYGGSFTTTLLNVDASMDVRWMAPYGEASGVFEYVELLNRGDECLLGVFAYNSEESVNTYVQRFGGDGGLRDKITVNDFAAVDIEISGNHVYQVGISGTYDGSITESTLTKHTLY